ncbi:MAG: hypothetical protein RMX96_12960 [Nostoc sp. ChiSLP02]|nr:hypothetical protein [Nostoc sp. DedSLP05]MDZ8098277.1 hypothetical protein [Nostoc sp. DedSLP01]MDZ8185751.1 hypothetical protein [Nostoc sp. ChiSLP02]
MTYKFSSIILGSLGFTILINNVEANAVTQIAQTINKTTQTALICQLEEAKSNFDDYGKITQIVEVAKQYIKAGQKNEAEKILSSAFDIAKLKNEAYFFYPVANAYIEMGNNEQALVILSATLEVIKKSPLDAINKINELRALLSLYSKFNPQAKAIILDEISKTIDTIEYPYSKIEPLTNLALGYYEQGEKNKASEILAQAVNLTNNIENPALKGDALVNIAQQYTQLRILDKTITLLTSSLRTLKDIKTQENKASFPNSFTVSQKITQEYSKLEKYNEALQVAINIKESEYKTRALVDIVDSYTKAGNQKAASKILSLAFSTALKIKEPSERIPLLQEVAIRYAILREYQLALKATQDIDGTFNIDALVEVVKKSAADPNKNIPSEVLSQTIKAIETIETAEGKAQALALVLDSYPISGEPEKINAVLSQAFAVAQTLENVRNRSTVLIEIADKYGEAGQKQKAVEILSEAAKITATLPVGESKYDRLGNDAGYGDYTEILQTYSKPYLLEKIALLYFKIAEFKKAIQVAQSIDEMETQAYVLTDIGAKYLELKQRDKGLQTFTQASTIAKKISFAAFRDKALLRIAIKYIDATLYEEALKVSNGIEFEPYRLIVLEQITNIYMQLGNKEKAITTLSQGLAKLPKTTNNLYNKLTKRLACYQIN